MSCYKEEWRLGKYRELTNDDGTTYTYVKVDEVHRSHISTVWIGERQVPSSEVYELCVVKETTSIIEGTTLERSPQLKVKLYDYLRQLKLVSHVNLVKFHGWGKKPLYENKYSLVLICEYCPGT